MKLSICVDEMPCERMLGIVPVDRHLKEALLRRGGDEGKA